MSPFIVKRGKEQVAADRIVDALVKFRAWKPIYTVMNIDNLLDVCYEGVKPEEFGKGAGYDFRDGTLSGMCDSSRRGPSEFKVKNLLLERVNAKLLYPRLLIEYNVVEGSGRAPKLDQPLKAEFIGVRTELQISRCEDSPEKLKIDYIRVIYAESSSIYFGCMEIRGIGSDKLESKLRCELRNVLENALMQYYQRKITY